jgi:hypothetical protein
MMVLVSCCAAIGAPIQGFPFREPLSAQATMPSRPSGARKKQKTAENEGSTGQGVIRPPLRRAIEVLRGHAENPRKTDL